MKKYNYIAGSKSPIIMIKRSIGFELFCHRHKNKIQAKIVCKALNIRRSTLDAIELGKYELKQNTIYKLFEYYNLEIELKVKSSIQQINKN